MFVKKKKEREKITVAVCERIIKHIDYIIIKVLLEIL